MNTNERESEDNLRSETRAYLRGEIIKMLKVRWLRIKVIKKEKYGQLNKHETQNKDKIRQISKIQNKVFEK